MFGPCSNANIGTLLAVVYLDMTYKLYNLLKLVNDLFSYLIICFTITFSLFLAIVIL